MVEPKNENLQKLFEELVGECAQEVTATFAAGPAAAAAKLKELITGLNGLHDALLLEAEIVRRGTVATGPGRN